MAGGITYISRYHVCVVGNTDMVQTLVQAGVVATARTEYTPSSNLHPALHHAIRAHMLCCQGHVVPEQQHTCSLPVFPDQPMTGLFQTLQCNDTPADPCVFYLHR
jgi:hypothetical protein